MACFLAATLLASSALADTIVLKNGVRLEGEILKEDGSRVIVDLGFQTVDVPLAQIAERKKSGAPAASVEQTGPGIYSVSTDRKVKSVDENVRELGEGVVLISTPAGLGSGFIINKRGWVVTNAHVIEGEQNIAVTVFKSGKDKLAKEKFEEVKILAINPFVDLALLEVVGLEKESPVVVTLAESTPINQGDDVFAIGNPLGLERSVSKGIISTNNREFGGMLYLQHTAPINPGNSGGPLFNLRGQVIGVNNMAVRFTDGLGFAIPVSALRDFLDNFQAFAFEKDNPNTGYRYLAPPTRDDMLKQLRDQAKPANGKAGREKSGK
ncbi:MAG: hypothetical protein GMKNLPBB_00673 [Myxococcota bacterium]|nr:hypothetical protein [Myxococcota bacterium]